MNAIIYAAGRATRLGPAFAHQPKILLEVGGVTLLERHVIRLAEVGARRIVVVTGHCREAIAKLLPALKREHRVDVVEVYNPDYGEGSAVSMLVSLPELERAAKEGPFLLMDGDVIYDSRMLPKLMGSPDRSALLVDFNYSTADDDPVLVPILDGRPTEFLKKWRGTADRVGESVGFFKLDPAEVPHLVAETLARSVGRARLDSMDEILRSLVLAQRFGFVDITGLPWTEIDFPEDVTFAREEVFPRLVELPSSVASGARPAR